MSLLEFANGESGLEVRTKINNAIDAINGRTVVSVKDYGAVGDGVTNDTAAVQAALTASLVVYAPAGEYDCEQLTLRTGQQIFGDGQDATIIRHRSGTNAFGLFGTGVNSVRIADLTLAGNSAGNLTGGMGLRIEGSSSNITLENVRMTDWRLDGASNISSGAGFDVLNCRVDSNIRDGVSCTTVTRANVQGSKLEGNGRFGAVFGAGCNLARLANNIITGNSATDASGAGALAVNCADPVFVGNNVSGNVLGHGLQFNTVSRGLMTGNISQGNGISGLDSFASQFVTIGDNVSFNNAVRGIEIDSASYYNTVTNNVVYRNGEVGISVFRSPGTNIIGNMTTENGVTAANKFGIRLWDTAGTLPSSGCRIIGNVCTDDRGGSATQAYGISLEDNATNTTMTGNKLTPNVTGAVNLVSGNFIFCEANEGYAVAPTNLTLQNGWVAFDTNWQQPTSYIDAAGVVHITGSIKNGTTTAGTVVATLPAGQRPAKVEGPFQVYGESVPVSFYILTNGDIVAQSALSATRTALAGISFKAA